MRAYKLLRVLKDGSITPLFINKSKKLPIGEWIEAESHPTKGYKYRPFWHCTSEPKAPHLSLKGRDWYEVEMDTFSGYDRPESQGRQWYLAQRIKIIRKILTIDQVCDIHRTGRSLNNEEILAVIAHSKSSYNWEYQSIGYPGTSGLIFVGRPMIPVGVEAEINGYGSLLNYEEIWEAGNHYKNLMTC